MNSLCTVFTACVNVSQRGALSGSTDGTLLYIKHTFTFQLCFDFNSNKYYTSDNIFVDDIKVTAGDIIIICV